MTDSWLPEQGSMTFVSLNFKVLEWPIKVVIIIDLEQKQKSA